MNGPEHYREAQRLTAEADQLYRVGFEESARTAAALAQAHATLALAAVALKDDADRDAVGNLLQAKADAERRDNARRAQAVPS